jgi:nucleotide-binding universal stress UspA family protein
MFGRILIPTDLTTSRAVKALEISGRIAQPDGSQIYLLHVIEMIAGAGFEELASFYRTLEEKARARLNEIVDLAVVTQGQVKADIVYGQRTEQVLEFVTAKQIDLIVLPSHPIVPSQPYHGWGTMSYKIGILAPCPVLLVK